MSSLMSTRTGARDQGTSQRRLHRWWVLQVDREFGIGWLSTALAEGTVYCKKSLFFYRSGFPFFFERVPGILIYRQNDSYHVYAWQDGSLITKYFIFAKKRGKRTRWTLSC
jgi:hypothetical protein